MSSANDQPTEVPSDREIATAQTLGAAESGLRPAESPLARGARLSRYIVIDKVGEGGMGQVYSAYDPQLDRRVALKVIGNLRRAKDRGAARARLLREAQAMAKLRHPNVISVHDAGTVNDRVFIAMSYIEGGTLAHWLNEEDRTPREILDKFAQAGRGLAAAHRAGMIHRDFKPENCLVDVDGRVFVTDFGLARSLGEASVSSSTGSTPLVGDLTVTGDVLGTPAFMSPEQRAGESTDQRTDIFAFCVAVFWAVYGVHPYGSKNRWAIDAAIEEGRIADPPEPGRLPLRIRNALHKGLAGPREQRFSSMEPLLRALEGSTGKTARALIGLAVVGVVGATVGIIATQSPERCDEVGEEVAAAWGDQRREAIRGSLVGTEFPGAEVAASRVETRVDGYLEKWEAVREGTCEDPSLPEGVVTRRLECLQDRLDDLRTLSDLLVTADRGVAQRAVPMAGSLEDPSACESLRPESSLSEVERVRAAQIRRAVSDAKLARAAGKNEAALTGAREADAMAGELGVALLRSQAKLELGRALLFSGENAEAEATIREAVALATEADDPEQLAKSWMDLMSVIADEGGRPEEAARLIPIVETAVARTDDDVLNAVLVQDIGLVHFALGDYAEAERSFRQAIVMRGRFFESGDLALARLQSNIGASLAAQGKFTEADAAFRASLRLREETLGSGHPELAPVLYNLAHGQLELRQYDDALRTARRLVELQRASFGKESLRAVDALELVGAVHARTGKPEAAIEVLEPAIELRAERLGEEHPSLVTPLTNYGNALHAQGRLDDAIAALERARDILLRNNRADHPRAASLNGWLAIALRDAGRTDEAAKMQEAALNTLDKELGPDHPRVADLLSRVADRDLADGDREQALARYRRVAEIRAKSQNPLLLSDAIAKIVALQSG